MTQTQVVLKHLRGRGPLTSVVAIGLYGITRLAAVVNRANKELTGETIKTTMKKGVRATYAEYSLVKKAA